MYKMVDNSKYRNRKVTIDGITFDSKKEYYRYLELIVMQRAGLISGLELQKEFVLIPSQREYGTKGKALERAVKYYADFAYYDEQGNYIVEDAKGKRTTEYIIKRKLMLYVHGIRIKEV